MGRAPMKSQSNSREVLIVGISKSVEDLISQKYKDPKSRGAIIAKRVGLVCHRLISALPIRNPSATAAVELGILSYGKEFPRKQTLYNNYKEILALYRNCFIAIVGGVSPESFADKAFITKSEIGGYLDFGTRRRIELMIDIYKEQLQEIRRLRNLLKATVPVPLAEADISHEAKMLTNIEIELISAWEHKVSNGSLKLEVDSLGLRVMRQAGTRPHVMTIDEYEAIKSLVRAYEDPSRSR
jgi:hypothetical protein